MYWPALDTKHPGRGKLQVRTFDVVVKRILYRESTHPSEIGSGAD